MAACLNKTSNVVKLSRNYWDKYENIDRQLVPFTAILWNSLSIITIRRGIKYTTKEERNLQDLFIMNEQPYRTCIAG